MTQPTVPLPPPEPPPSQLNSTHTYDDGAMTVLPVLVDVFSDDSDDNDMADLPTLVDYVSSDEESDDGSAESYEDELKALYDDRDSGT